MSSRSHDAATDDEGITPIETAPLLGRERPAATTPDPDVEMIRDSLMRFGEHGGYSENAIGDALAALGRVEYRLGVGQAHAEIVADCIEAGTTFSRSEAKMSSRSSDAAWCHAS